MVFSLFGSSDSLWRARLGQHRFCSLRASGPTMGRKRLSELSLDEVVCRFSWCGSLTTRCLAGCARPNATNPNGAHRNGCPCRGGVAMNQPAESSGANCGGNMPLMSTGTTSRTNAVGKVAAEDYASEQQKTELQKLRRQRLDLQAQLEAVAAAEAAILVELEQVATAGGEPDLLYESDSSEKHQRWGW